MSEIAASNRGVVVAPCRAAAETGRLILGERGNAFEAVTAMAATMAALRPHLAGVGGDGVWMLRDPSGVVGVIDACGRAGAEATPALYRAHDVVPTRGPLAALTVPGAVSGWSLALEIAASVGGRLPLDVLLGDALRHAREGLLIPRCLSAPNDRDDLFAAPGFSAAFMSDGKLPEGERLMQQKLADMLDHLIRAGLSDFYRGDVAREVVDDFGRIAAPLSRDDFRTAEARLQKPLALGVEGGTVFDAGPPARGLGALVLLGVLERLKLSGDRDAAFVHAVIEAAGRAEALDRRTAAEPGPLDDDPASHLTIQSLDREAAAIDRLRAAPAGRRRRLEARAVWFGAIDADGRAAACVQSLGAAFGSGCVSPSTGVLMGNAGAAFSLDPDDANPLAPGGRPPHALNAPLAVMADGRVLLLGGGEPTAQAMVFLRHVRLGRAIEHALATPRAGGGSDGALILEPGFDGEVADRLDGMGHDVALREAAPNDASAVGLIVRDAAGRILGGADPRSDGAALGL